MANTLEAASSLSELFWTEVIKMDEEMIRSLCTCSARRCRVKTQEISLFTPLIGKKDLSGRFMILKGGSDHFWIK